MAILKNPAPLVNGAFFMGKPMLILIGLLLIASGLYGAAGLLGYMPFPNRLVGWLSEASGFASVLVWSARPWSG
jgi:hypothetical protein